MTRDDLEARLRVAPFHQWLDLKVLSMDEDGVEFGASWREEFKVNPERDYTHGGILAALVDICGDYALAAKIGRPVPTVDLRVDYHRAAMPGDLRIKARVIKAGRSFSTAEASVFDSGGKLVASGRAVYHSAPPE